MSLSCINKYLAIDSGGNGVNGFRAVIIMTECFPEWSSWRRNERVKCKAVQQTGYCTISNYTFTFF